MFLKCGVLFAVRPQLREACAVFQSQSETTAERSSRSQRIIQGAAALRRSPVTGVFTKRFNGIIFCCASLRSEAEPFV